MGNQIIHLTCLICCITTFTFWWWSGTELEISLRYACTTKIITHEWHSFYCKMLFWMAMSAKWRSTIWKIPYHSTFCFLFMMLLGLDIKVMFPLPNITSLCLLLFVSVLAKIDRADTWQNIQLTKSLLYYISFHFTSYLFNFHPALKINL